MKSDVEIGPYGGVNFPCPGCGKRLASYPKAGISKHRCPECQVKFKVITKVKVRKVRV